MPHAIGRKLTLSFARRFFRDLLLRARRNPIASMQRRMRLAAVAAARELAVPRPSWQAIFLKAFAHVSAGNPLLRRCHLSWPWPRWYQHAETVAAIPVERPQPTFVLLPGSETLRLSEVDAALQEEERIATLPDASHFALRLGLACSGRVRAAHCGTFSLSATQREPVTPFVPALHHGPVDERDEANVCLTYDLRVLDSFDAARALGELEQVLHERILTELRYIESLEVA